MWFLNAIIFYKYNWKALFLKINQSACLYYVVRLLPWFVLCCCGCCVKELMAKGLCISCVWRIKKEKESWRVSQNKVKLNENHTAKKTELYRWRGGHGFNACIQPYKRWDKRNAEHTRIQLQRHIFAREWLMPVEETVHHCPIQTHAGTFIHKHTQTNTHSTQEGRVIKHRRGWINLCREATKRKVSGGLQIELPKDLSRLFATTYTAYGTGW